MSLRAFTLACGLALWAAASPGWAACALTKIVELPVTMHGLRPMVSVKINGADESLIVGSGSFNSTLPSDMAAALKLPQLHSVRPVSIGGIAYKSELTTVKTLTLADQTLHDVPFIITPEARVGAIGQNLLGLGDVEYDFANGALRLFKAQNCARSNMAYWLKGEDFSALTIEWQNDRNPHTKANAQVNGVPITVMFSTGSRASELSLNAAKRIGLDVDGPDARYVGLIHGIGPYPVKAWIVQVASFKIGKEDIRNTQLRVIDEASPGLQTDMLLGADFFLSHRVFVANSQHQLYFSYNGGPVFRLDEPGGAKPDEDQSRPKTF